MTNTKALEYRIARQLLDRRVESTQDQCGKFVERFILIAAATAGLFVMGSYLQELLAVVIASGAVLALGSDA